MNDSRSTLLLLHPNDDVAVAVAPIAEGESLKVGGGVVVARQAILPGHKIALRTIAEGSEVRKYGQVIGLATRDIASGAHVHSHNLACGSSARNVELSTAVPPLPDPQAPRSWQGYLRPDGRAGTRNYIAVISTVNCAASSSRFIANHFTPEVMRSFPHVDGIVPITHKTGCGMAASGIDREMLHRTLGGIARHVNVFGYVIVGLGCETNQAHEFIDAASLRGPTGRPPTVLTVQGSGGLAQTVERGIRAVGELLPAADSVRRQPVPVRSIVLGTNCGGSDGYSGITANPALGIASDLVIGHGGTSILGETTEIYGAEHLLTRRASSPEVGRKLLEKIRWWEWYTSLFGAQIDNNPSYGNKEGGLTTIYEKSLGAIAKGGSTPLVDVVSYAEPVTRPGLVVMDTPGFDPVSVTGIVAGGANVMVFTTGRGSVLGTKPTPTIKVATHSLLYQRMPGDMDFNAGVVLEGRSVDEVGRQLFELILETASGRRTKSEEQGVGDDEFAPWTIGPVL